MELNEDDILIHYGVKGMKWGRRKARPSKAERDNPNSGYSDEDRNRDAQKYGRRGAVRINRRMNRGSSLRMARAREGLRREITNKAVGAAFSVGTAVAIASAPRIFASLDKAGAFAQRMSNLATQKQIGPGYETVQMILNKSGKWVVK